MAQRPTLDVYYDLASKELGIKFHTAQQAQQYQERNREARILADDDETAWIPIPKGMTQLRASSFGFVMCFESSDAAATWCRRVVLGALYDGRDRNTREAYIIREWSEHDLNQKLLGRANQLGVPERAAEHRGPSPGREFKAAEAKKKEPAGFGIAPARPPGKDAYYEDPEPRETRGKKWKPAGFGIPYARQDDDEYCRYPPPKH